MCIKEIHDLLVELKKNIGDEYRAFEDDDIPGMQVTVACDDDAKSWSYQTGDNSYSGGAYGFPHWSVVGLYRRSNCTELAREIVSELKGLAYEARTYRKQPVK